VAPLGVSTSEDAMPPGMGYGRQALRCTVASASRRARRSGCCLQLVNHGAAEGNGVHGGHGSGGLDLHVDHGGGHGVHLECKRSSGLGFS
jgi:hypothetical protein